MRRNVLIFHQAALGDFVVTWTLAVACGRMFAQSRIVYVTASQKGKLAEHALGVESVDAENFSGLWSENPNVSSVAKKWLDGAAAIFTFVAGGGEVWMNNVNALAPAARKFTLSTKPPADFEDLAGRYIALQLAEIDPSISSGVLQMIDSFANRGVGRRSGPGEGIVIHPGSGAERKNWGREKFIELARRLRKEQRVQVVLGEVEIEKWGESARQEFADAVGKENVLSPPTLVDLAQLLSAAKTAIANDSGPAHLAAALGVKTLAIFGPTSNAAQWRPLGPAVKVLNVPSLDSLDVGQVLAAHKEFSRQ